MPAPHDHDGRGTIIPHDCVIGLCDSATLDDETEQVLIANPGMTVHPFYIGDQYVRVRGG